MSSASLDDFDLTDVLRYMRPGYDADDLYRMVEDEFYDIAQKYTSHLHYAEYQRLKTQTKQSAFQKTLAMKRPVDGKTVLDMATKKKQEAVEQANRTNQAVKNLTSKARNNAGTDEESEDLVEEADRDPWVGTSLHGLMSGEPRKSTALVGLDGVRSHTKAAKGFGSPRKNRSSKPRFQPSSSRQDSHTYPNGRGIPIDVQDEDSDDLSTLPLPPPPSIKPASWKDDEKRQPASTDIERKTKLIKQIFSSPSKVSSSHNTTLPVQQEYEPQSPTAHLKPKPIKSNAGPSTSNSNLSTSTRPRRSAIAFLDDWDDDILPYKSRLNDRPKTTAASPPQGSNREGLGYKDKKGKGKEKAKFDEIPLFLG